MKPAARSRSSKAAARSVQETRLFDSRQGETRSMRSKEEAHDYRYFPDPDLLPLELDAAWVAEIAKSLPELPDEKKARFMATRDCRPMTPPCWWRSANSPTITRNWPRAWTRKSAANWLNNEVLGRLNRDGLSIGEVPVSAAANNAIIADGRGQDHLRQDRQGPARHRVEARAAIPRQSWRPAASRQVTDTGAIDAAIEAVIAANPDKVEEVKAKPKLAAWFVGQVMKQTGGKANPAGRQRCSQDPTQSARRGVICTFATVDPLARLGQTFSSVY